MNGTTLVVLAHPEPRSFNGAWAEATRAASEASGRTVSFSDLVATGFDPVERRAHYPALDDVADALPFDPLKVQGLAAARGCLPTDVAAEIEKIRAADRLVLHFPLWWFGPPAVLKGWLDRCLVHGALHTSSRRFDNGPCRGKKALFCVSTGSTAAESSPAGREGNASMLLWSLAYTLHYVGFTILQPRLVHGVHGFHEASGQAALERRLRAVLADQHRLFSRFDDLPLIPFNRDDEFDADGILKPDAPSHDAFIRRGG